MRIVIEIVEISTGTYLGRSSMIPGCVVVGCSAEDARDKMADTVRGHLASSGIADLEWVEVEPTQTALSSAY